MALIVVGGQTKHVGKTMLICEIIRAFVSARWTAAKITPHLHEPEQCALIASGSGWRIWEQGASSPRVDTARYLNAGAVRSLLVSAESENLAVACAAFKAEISPNGNAIVESTAGADVLDPDLFLLVVDPRSREFKASANEQLARAQAVVMSAEAQSTGGVEYPEHIRTFSKLEKGIDLRLARMIEGLLE